MEMFGLLLAVPATLVASTIYCFVAAVVFAKIRLVRRVALVGSPLVLLGVLVEIALLLTLGPKTSYIRLGLGFALLHLTCFWLGPPAVANLALLSLFRKPDTRKWPRIMIAIMLCWFVCMPTVVVNITVDERIVGVNADKPFWYVDPSSLAETETSH
jgi:hypothetical protein